MKNLVLLTCFFILAISCKRESKAVQETEDMTIYPRAEEMPRFAACEDKGNIKAIQDCATLAMFEYIRNNINYPEAAKLENKEGKAVVSFIVLESGKIDQVELVKDPGFGMGEEALRIVRSFPDWIPGKEKGKKVKVQYFLPVKFKI